MNVLWRSPQGEETQSFALVSGQTEADADGAIASTYHGHEYVFRSAVDGTLLNFWRASANPSLGWPQIVEVGHAVDVTLTNQFPERVVIFTNPRETRGPEGTLDRGSGNPLNCDKIVVTTHHGYHIVAEDAEGAVLFSHQVNAQTGGSKQTLYLRHQLEHSEEL